VRELLSSSGTELLLIRHGQMAPIDAPDEDPPLTEIGREQVEVLAAFLAEAPLAAVYSSPTLRAQQTAAAIAAPHALSFEVDEGLREAETYVPPGKRLRDVLGEEAYREVMRRFRRERIWDVFGEHRETSAGIRGRTKSTIESIIARHQGGRVAVVTHNPVISAYLAIVLKSAYDMPFYFSLTGISVVFAEGESREVRAINSTPHFRSL
jgi:probable phosphoglycerate mutase